jgi:hypothetical protein
MGDMLRTYNFAEEHVIQQHGRDQQDPFDGFIAAVSFAIRATYQTAIGTSPASLGFLSGHVFPDEICSKLEVYEGTKKPTDGERS